MSRIVRYQRFDGTDGLTTTGGELRAYRGGELVAAAKTDGALDELLAGYIALGLLPDVEFTYTTPREYVVEVGIDFQYGGREINGRLKLPGSEYDGADLIWRAELTNHPEFLRAGELPEGARPWVSKVGGRTPDQGWEITLPPAILGSRDVALIRRVGETIEAYLCAIEADRPVDHPYRRKISNVFSAHDPLWAVNLPRILTPEEIRNRR
jgi:hypothetical protein